MTRGEVTTNSSPPQQPTSQCQDTAQRSTREKAQSSPDSEENSAFVFPPSPLGVLQSSTVRTSNTTLLARSDLIPNDTTRHVTPQATISTDHYRDVLPWQCTPTRMPLRVESKNKRNKRTAMISARLTAGRDTTFQRRLLSVYNRDSSPSTRNREEVLIIPPTPDHDAQIPAVHSADSTTRDSEDYNPSSTSGGSPSSSDPAYSGPVRPRRDPTNSFSSSSIEVQCPTLSEYRRLDKDRSHTRLQTRKERQPWGPEEEEAVIVYVRKFGACWRAILDYDKGLQGRKTLLTRSNVAVKDKAINLATCMIRSGAPLHPNFQRLIPKLSKRGQELTAKGYTW